jgi:hypothetical protein
LRSPIQIPANRFRASEEFTQGHLNLKRSHRIGALPVFHPKAPALQTKLASEAIHRFKTPKIRHMKPSSHAAKQINQVQMTGLNKQIVKANLRRTVGSNPQAVSGGLFTVTER